MARIYLKIACIHIIATAVVFAPIAFFSRISFPFGQVGSYAAFSSALLIVFLLISTKMQDFSFLFSSLEWVSKDRLPIGFISYIEELSLKSGFRIARWGVIPDNIPQIFSYGLNPSQTRIVVSEGFLKDLSSEEQQSLLAVQTGRIANRDTLLITYLQTLPTLVYMGLELIESGLKTALQATSQKSEKDFDPSKIIAYLWVIYFALEFFVLWVQRRCDLRADQFAFGALGDADRISMALARIQNGSSQQTVLNLHPGTVFGESGTQSGQQFQSIEQKIQWDLKNPWAPLFELLSPNALLGRRIEALSELAKQKGVPTKFQPVGTRNPLQLRLLFQEISGVLTAIGFCALGAVVQFGLLPRMPVDDFFTKYWIALTGFTCIGLYLLVTSFLPKGNAKESSIRALLEDLEVGPLKGRTAIIKGSIVGVGDPGKLFYPRLRIRDTTGELEIQSYSLTNNDIISNALEGHVLSTATLELYGLFRRSSVPSFDVYKAVGPAGTAQSRPRFLAGLIFIVLPIGYYAVMYLTNLN